MLERVVFPSIGSMPVREITPTHVLGILQKTAKRGAPTVAAEARRMGGQIGRMERASTGMTTKIMAPDIPNSDAVAELRTRAEATCD